MSQILLAANSPNLALSFKGRKLPQPKSRFSSIQSKSSDFYGQVGLLNPRAVKSIAKTRTSAGLSISSVFDFNQIDKDKHEGNPYRRTVFTFDDWRKHRSSSRYFRHLQTMFGSRVVAGLWPPVISVTGIAALVVAINIGVQNHELPDYIPLLHINALPFSLTSSALSFLLVFRTNASYGRFDEARKMWGLMLNRCRDIGRQALSYMARGEYEYERPKLLQFIRHLQAFPLTYKHHFLQEGDLEYDLRTETSLTESEIKGVLGSTHRPNYVLQMCSEVMSRTHMDPVPRLSMDANLTTFADDIGGSERIFKTPIPLSYTRLTSRFLITWHIFLPLGLWDACGILTIPVTAFIAAVLFCVDEVGVLIEEPFSILALGVIAQSARNNVGELLNLHDGMKNLVVPDDIPKLPVRKENSPSSKPTVNSPVYSDVEGRTPAEAVLPSVSATMADPAISDVNGTDTSSMTPSFLPQDNGSAIRTDAPSWLK